MKSSVEALEGNKVKLYIEIEEADMAEAVDQAWGEIAKEVRLPGFRPGKAPKKVVMARMGGEYARSEAIRTVVPQNFAVAVSEHLVDIIGQPEFTITDGEESGALEYEAVVEVRPTIELTGYASMSIEVPSPSPSDDQVADQIDRLRAQFGELTDVDRAARIEDFVSIDLLGTQDGEPVPGLAAEDYLYQIGSGLVTPLMDDQLVGASVGDTVSFSAPRPGAGADDDADDVDYELVVKAVKERVLPDLNDEWVADATEFETVAELRDDIVERLSSSRLIETQNAVRSRIGLALAEMVTEDPPESVIREAMQEQLEDLSRRVAAQGMKLEQFLAMTGQDPDMFAAGLRSEAAQSSKVEMALRAIASAQGLECTDEDLEAEIVHLAFHAEIDPAEARHNLQRNGYLVGVRSDVTKRKALDWLIETIEITDPEGNAVDRSMLIVPEHDHSDHDHEGHDHDHDEDHDHTSDGDEDK